MTDVERFVEKFTEIWADPQPGRFPELFTEDAWLLHPGMTAQLPVSEVATYIAGVKAGAPDIHLTPGSWAVNGSVLFIDWTMHATMDGAPISWIGADKCILRGDRAVSITAYFDTHPIWVAIDPTLRRDTLLEAAVQRRADVTA